MTALTMHEIQHNYRERKQKSGWRRIQIWRLDETNKQVKMRIKMGAKLINQTQDEASLVKKLSMYSHKMLQDIPL